MNREFALSMTINILRSIAIFFQTKDGDNAGNDDRIARIIGYACNELEQYLAEEKAAGKEV